MTDMRESTLHDLGGALRAASPATRRHLTMGAFAVVLVLGLQALDASGRSGPAVVAEMVSVLFGTLGTGLFFATRILSHAMAPRSGVLSPDGRLVVLLPMLAFAAAILLAMAVGVVAMRVVLGSGVGLIGAIAWTAMLALCGWSVFDTLRTLRHHALDQGEHAARARAEAAQAQLATLQAQLNPHFLFNALNTVACLVRTNPEQAERGIERLASVMRRTIDRSAETWSSLADEVEYLEAYLDLEQLRFGDRLRVEWRIAPDALAARIPPLTLQPLVENALRHGIGGRIEGGWLRIGAERRGDRLHLEVADDGGGFPLRWREGTGIGNLRRRLDALYGNGAVVAAAAESAGAPGAIVRVEMRFETGGMAADARADRR